MRFDVFYAQIVSFKLYLKSLITIDDNIVPLSDVITVAHLVEGFSLL